jgi:hypothetical protein
MKKSFLSLAMITFIAGTLSVSFGQAPVKAVLQPQENLTVKSKDVMVVTTQPLVVVQDTLTDRQKFDKAAGIKFLANEKSVADLRLKILDSDSTKMVDNGKRLDILELKNTALKSELALYKAEGEAEWTAYKEKFTSELTLLTKELVDFKIE